MLKALLFFIALFFAFLIMFSNNPSSFWMKIKDFFMNRNLQQELKSEMKKIESQIPEISYKLSSLKRIDNNTEIKEILKEAPIFQDFPEDQEESKRKYTKKEEIEDINLETLKILKKCNKFIR